jgi:hypothetical protein
MEMMKRKSYEGNTKKGRQSKEEEYKHIVNEVFPYVQHSASDLPRWQKAKIVYMPYRPYLEGTEVWIRVGDGVEVKNMDTGNQRNKIVYITNLNGPYEEEDVVGLSRNMIERQSSPNDFSWDDVKRIKHKDWDKGIVELSEEQKERITRELEALRAWSSESIAIYKKYMRQRERDIALGILTQEGKVLL